MPITGYISSDIDGKNEVLVDMDTINTNYARDITLCNQYGITSTYYTSIYNTLNNMINSIFTTFFQ